ncbi:aminotransferase class I/II-fold pyridoxal phosphate-dependent enzyme, partial [Blautia sp. MSK22_86]|nr:aminotransferase class I/II-fold pyridoxal phosphate-dependent enzyme [Blautia sp. MSK22_86]
MEAIGRWAVEHHIWIISDEIYEHLNYDDARTTYIGAAVPECRDQLLVLNGVAKTYAMPGWRVGWMVAPA